MKRWLLASALGLCEAAVPLQSLAAGATAPAYEDRTLDDGPQRSAEPEDETAPDTGWPRSLAVEWQDWRQSAAGKVRNQSLLLSGQLDTPDYGSLSFNLNLNRFRNDFVGVGGFGSGSYLGSFRNGNIGRIDQRGMPFNGGWFANNSLGDISTASTAMSRGLGRVYLPTLPIEGIATTLERPGRTSVNFSYGRLGYFEGLDSQGFSLGRGSAVSAGIQQRLGGGDGPLALNRTDAAFQWVSTRRFDIGGLANSAQDTDSYWGALSWQGLAPWASTLEPGYGDISDRPGGLRVQGNVARSRGRPSDGSSLAPRDAANGAWIDAAWRTDWLKQGASVFYFDPGLRWGSNPIAGDLRGASWRGDVSTRQWQLGANIELSESVSGLSGRSLFGNLLGRYRIDSRDAVSATLAARTGALAAQSVRVNWEHQSHWGQTQWRAEAAHGRTSTSTELGVDHAWTMPEGQTLSTSLGLQRSAFDAAGTVNSLSYGVVGSLPVGAGGRLDLTLRGKRDLSGSGGATGRLLNASVRMSWPIGGGWSVVTQYTAVRAHTS